MRKLKIDSKKLKILDREQVIEFDLLSVWRKMVMGVKVDIANCDGTLNPNVSCRLVRYSMSNYFEWFRFAKKELN